jgi:ribA/ribD-fused uncharacterized protein
MTTVLPDNAQVPSHHYSDNPDEAVFFYGGPFSNFVGGPFIIASEQPWSDSGSLLEYETVEHFFAASKALDEKDHLEIRNKRGPLKAKQAGRRTLLRTDWEDVKFDVMLTGLRVKFAEPYYRQALLATGNRLIAEDSPYDAVWGIRNKHGEFTGTNLLGVALMQVRNELIVAGYE